MIRYRSLYIDIRPSTGQHYHVEITGFAGEARGTFTLPPTAKSSVERAQRGDWAHHTMGTLGVTLFQYLFQNSQLRSCYDRAIGQLAQNDRLRLVFVIDPMLPEVWALPWEELRDPAEPVYAIGSTSIVRYIAYERRPPDVQINEPLRVLLTMACHAPHDLVK